MARSPEHLELRRLLGERIPEGGEDFDTMFFDDEIEQFLEKGASLPHPVEAAAYYGWKSKAGELANLTNVIEGNSSREMAELHAQALRMMREYMGFVPTPGRGMAIVSKIRRPGVTS